MTDLAERTRRSAVAERAERGKGASALVEGQRRCDIRKHSLCSCYSCVPKENTLFVRVILGYKKSVAGGLWSPSGAFVL